MILSVRLSNVLIDRCHNVGKTVSWRWSEKKFNFGNLAQVTIARSRYHAIMFGMVTFPEPTDCVDSLTPVAFNLTQVGCPHNSPVNQTRLASTGLIATGFNPNFSKSPNAPIPFTALIVLQHKFPIFPIACSTGGVKLDTTLLSNTQLELQLQVKTLKYQIRYQ